MLASVVFFALLQQSTELVSYEYFLMTFVLSLWMLWWKLFVVWSIVTGHCILETGSNCVSLGVRERGSELVGVCQKALALDMGQWGPMGKAYPFCHTCEFSSNLVWPSLSWSELLSLSTFVGVEKNIEKYSGEAAIASSVRCGSVRLSSVASVYLRFTVICFGKQIKVCSH
jgi:hypothetical protein